MPNGWNFPETSMDPQDSLRSDAKVRILVVDDDQDNLLLINYQLLQLLDCAVISAQTGQMALTFTEQYQPDLILLDIMLPEMDGLEVVRRLKENPDTRHIPVVAVTAMARSLDKDLALAAGCDDYVCKPYEIELLADAIARNLNSASPLLHT